MMMQQSREVGRSGGDESRGVEVCSVMFLVISIGYCSTIFWYIYGWENLLEDTVIFWRLPKHTAGMCLCRVPL
jgi:hypothetical protein